MKSFALALLSAGAFALNTSVFTPPVIPSAKKYVAASGANASLKFGWVGTTIYFQPSLQVTGAGTNSSIEYEIAFPFTYASSKVATVSCHFSALTSANYAVTFSVYDWNASWDTTAVNGTTKISDSGNDSKRVATVTITGVTDATAPTVTSSTQSGGTNGNWGITSASTASYTDSSKVLVCAPQVEYVATSISNALAAWNAGSGGLFTSSSFEVFLGETETASSAATVNERINATLAQGALSDAIAQVTTGTIANGTANAVSGFASAPSLRVICWTDT